MMETFLHKISLEKASKIKSQQMQRKSFEKIMKLMKATLLINRINLSTLLILWKCLWEIFFCHHRIHKNN